MMKNAKKNWMQCKKATNKQRLNAKFYSKILRPRLMDQFTFTINSTTFTKTIEDMLNQETTNNLLGSIRMYLNLRVAATQFTKLNIFGLTNNSISKISLQLLMFRCQLFLVDLLPKVFSTTLLNYGERVLMEDKIPRSQLMTKTLPGLLMSLINSKTLSLKMVRPTRIFNGKTCLINILSFG